jgi:SnoaL-like domain
MSEERAVQQVLAKYVRGVDTRDGAAVAALFTTQAALRFRTTTWANWNRWVNWWATNTVAAHQYLRPA